MSLSKGNVNRTRPPKHQNKSAFKNDLHDTSKRTKIINSLEVSGVCLRCKDVIEWKIKYKKYKPLSVPSKCVQCEQKTVKYAYHVLCSKCASDKAVCAKCHKPREGEQTSEPDKINNFESEIHKQLEGLAERKRRTILRYIEKLKSNERNITLTDLEKIILDLDNFKVTNDDLEPLPHDKLDINH